MAKLAGLNRDLIERYKNGENGTTEKLYLCNRDFIQKCANDICKKFNCLHLNEELFSAGTVAFLEHLENYESSSGAELTTYLYPHVMGAMRREVEKNLGCMSLPKRDFQKIRKAKAFYYANTEKGIRKQISLVAKNMGISELQVSQLIDYSLQSFSLNEMIDEDDDDIAVQIPSPQPSVQSQVYFKICQELLREAFENELSFKEREILGQFVGVYGYEKKTLPEIGEQFNMKENTTLKAKDKVLNKLTEICMNGKLGLWREVYSVVMEYTR